MDRAVSLFLTLLPGCTTGADSRDSDAYSPPFYAFSMEGYGVDYNAPRPPFVLAKLFWRSPLGLPLQAVYFLLSVLVRLFAGMLGFSAGFFGHGGDNAGGDGRPWMYREVEVGAEGWRDEGLMGADEYL